MERRLKLQEILEELLGSDNVYFQPPETLRIEYPCIIYKWDTGDTYFADDIPYIFFRRYQVTVIDQNPDSLIPDKVAKLPRCTMDRTYTMDNLNHYIFNLYY